MISDELKAILDTIKARDLNEIFVIDANNEKNITLDDFYKDILLLSREIDNYNLCNKIALVLENSYFLMVLYFSCLISKRLAIPIDPKLGQKRILEVLDELDDVDVVCEEGWDFGSIKKLGINDFFIQDKSGLNSIDFFEKINELDITQTYLITFTSGTSGKLKGVKNSLANLLLCANAFIKLHKINPTQIFAHNMVMTYMAGIFNTIFIPFVACSKIVLCERFSINFATKFWNIVNKYNIDTFWFSPTMLAMLQKMDRDIIGIEYCKKNETFWYVGTAPLTNKLKKEFEEKYAVKLYQSYGLSETLIISSVEEKSHNEHAEPGVGKLLSGVQISFDDNNEILLNVPWMYLGYTNTPDSEYFSNNMYKSGDVGVLKNNILFITDRKKDLIIRGGINLSPKLIETSIESISGVEEIAIVAIKDDMMSEKIGCALVLKKNVKLEDVKKQILEQVKSLGYGYTVDNIVVTDELCRNLNGKIDKNRIEGLF